MNHIVYKTKTCVLMLLAGTLILFSCNKDFPVAVPTPYVPPAGQTILQLLDNANFSLLKRAVGRVPTLSAQLGNANNIFTVFAPDNASFATIGITSNAQIDGMPLAQITAILNYHIIGGQSYPSPAISEKFPNMNLQSSLLLSPPSAAVPPGFRMPIFLSRRGANAWVNTLPIKQANIMASNGVVHVPASVVLPPDATIMNIIRNDPSYSYLLAAINRADSGLAATSPSRLDSTLNLAPANFTLMAPTDLAFQQTLTFLITQALISQGMDPATAQATAILLASTPAVFSNPALFGALNATTVRGLIAYHVIGRVSAENSALVGRVFGVNIPSVVTDVNTLLVIPPTPPSTTLIPPLQVKIQNTAGTITVKGRVNPTAATVTIADRHCVNGVIHRINGVLLPQ